MAAHSVPWDASFTIKPVTTDKVGETPDFISATRGATHERIAQEHSFRYADTANDNQGKHLQGSARALVNDTEPADPMALTDDGDYVVGRFLYKPTTRKLYIYKDTTDEWVDAVWDANGDFTARVLKSSIATGTAPLTVASTTAVPNLNADLHDGYHAGNANGNIPISNGTENTNLVAAQATQAVNADTVDSLHIGVLPGVAKISYQLNSASSFTVTAMSIGEIRLIHNTYTGGTAAYMTLPAGSIYVDVSGNAVRSGGESYYLTNSVHIRTVIRIS